MARLEDYLPKTDELEDEITNAVVQTNERKETAKTAIPERFEGKSAEDIAGSYTELEKLNSRQAQDLGEMRKQVDLLMRQSLEKATEAATPAPEEVAVTVDELYENPQQAIEKVIESKLRPQLEAQNNQFRQQAQESKLESMDAAYEGWQETVKTTKFQNWIDSTPYRQRMANAVRDYEDLDAASDLLAQFYETQANGKAEKEETRSQQLANATLTTGGSAYSEPTETMSRKELMNVRIRAKQGDRKADAWLKDNQDSIALAYAEGRIVD